MKNKENTRLVRFANLILDIGTYLLASGAHCGRVNSNIKRIANAWGFNVDMQPTFKGLLVSVYNRNNPSDNVTLYKEAPPYNVHLEILTKVSKLSWSVVEDGLSMEDTEKELEKIKNTTHYKPWIVSVAVGLSCGGLCLLSGGDLFNMLVTILAAFVGSLLRFQIVKMNFNGMISVIIAAFVTTMITGIGTIANIGVSPQAAMATAVLYLIPGVPLINSVIDLIEGYLSAAMNRMLFAGFFLLCIAAGMTLSITLIGIRNF
ncbi:threonine/serine exporter [Dysgonomonas sp. 216]|uniref:threonine/serine ThrE exporter family protein n=1 Tax=Dysgonomonas sp. 216 TaxID=2302934 RepID=UPI0013CF9227|nr:threonine/serine exporter family protein [Dysgonomonas sp. 216]NDW17782.1 threonine/serine exporter [Dysgonomonas sp. 216]